MDFDDQIELEHLLFFDRKCRVCGKVKSLMDDYYLTRRDRGTLPSSYSYECKECMKARSIRNRNNTKPICEEYPDW